MRKLSYLGLVGAGLEEVDLIGADGEDAESCAVEVDDAGRCGCGLVVGADVVEDGSHLLGGAGALDVDGAGLDVVVVYDAGVVVVADVGLGVLEAGAGGVHLGQDRVELGLGGACGAASGARMRAAASENWRRFMKAPRAGVLSPEC